MQQALTDSQLRLLQTAAAQLAQEPEKLELFRERLRARIQLYGTRRLDEHAIDLALTGLLSHKVAA